jgi:hypothetical protein
VCSTFLSLKKLFFIMFWAGALNPLSSAAPDHRVALHAVDSQKRTTSVCFTKRATLSALAPIVQLIVERMSSASQCFFVLKASMGWVLHKYTPFARMQEIVASDEAMLGPWLAGQLSEARKMAPASELALAPASAELVAAVLRKEAVYSVACSLDYELSDYVDFPDWLYGSLLPELTVVWPVLRLLFLWCGAS